jgi:hypothetical protein
MPFQKSSKIREKSYPEDGVDRSKFSPTEGRQENKTSNAARKPKMRFIIIFLP